LRSADNLRGLHQDLVDVILRANVLFHRRYKSYFTVIEGVRVEERQRQLYGQGRTKAECREAGIAESYARPDLPKVTWTLTSNHFVKPDGKGHAADLCHIVKSLARWEDAAKIAECMFEAGRELNVPIRWGKDWNRNGKSGEKGETDGPHFELWNPRHA